MEPQFPIVYYQRLVDAENVYVIANNTWISNRILSSIKPSKRDVIIQFNKSLYFDYFSTFASYKLFVFRQDGNSERFWGYDAVANRLRSETGAAGLVFVFDGEVNSALLAEKLQMSDQIRDYAVVPFGSAPPSFDDIDTFSDGGRISPTTGYLALRLLVEYIAAHQIRTSVIAVGFSGVPVSLWCGHEIEHEREWLRSSGVRLVKHSLITECVDRVWAGLRRFRAVCKRVVLG